MDSPFAIALDIASEHGMMRVMYRTTWFVMLFGAVLLACGDDASPDAGRADSGGRDAGAGDAGGRDAGGRDSSVADAGTEDDAGAGDAGSDAGSDAGTDSGGPPSDCPAGSALLLEKIGFDAYAFCDAVRLTIPAGSAPVPLAGLSLCANATCYPLEGEVGAGALIVRDCMFIGDSMPTFYVPMDLAYDRASGDVTLRTETSVCDYVQWGPGPHMREDPAVAAGQWTAGTSAPVAAGADHLVRTGAEEGGAAWAAMPGFP
jgi:hypothetical protein